MLIEFSTCSTERIMGYCCRHSVELACCRLVSYSSHPLITLCSFSTSHHFCRQKMQMGRHLLSYNCIGEELLDCVLVACALILVVSTLNIYTLFLFFRHIYIVHAILWYDLFFYTLIEQLPGLTNTS
jgi:hypothetical protein